MESSTDWINQLLPNLFNFGMYGFIGLVIGRFVKGMFTIILYCLGVFFILLYIFQDIGIFQVDLDQAQSIYDSNVSFVTHWLKSTWTSLSLQFPMVAGFLGGFYLGLKRWI